MNADFESAYLQLPSIQQFTANILDDLLRRRSVLLLLPTGVNPEQVWANIRPWLVQRGDWVEEIDVSSFADGESGLMPVEVLSQAFGLEWKSLETPRTLQNLLCIGKLPDVLRLTGLDELTGEQRGMWFELLSRWGEASQQLVNVGEIPTALCMVVRAKDVLRLIPDSNVYLAIYWWWGLPSILETRLLCRLVNSSESWSPSAQWREYILPSITLGDQELINYLWDKVEGDYESIKQHLVIFSEQRGWTIDLLQSWGIDQFNNSHPNYHHQLVSPSRYPLLWANGVVYQTPEFGLEVHTAAIAALGRFDVLKHRLWRAQSELLLPIIDDIRLRICGYLTEVYGEDWAFRWNYPNSIIEAEAVADNPFAVQWGYLEYLLMKHNRFKSERKLIPIVSTSRGVRNEIAHYRPISYRDYESFCIELDRVRFG